jgi:hypothetical protein
MNLFFWLLTLFTLDDIRQQGQTPDERQAESDQFWFVITAGLSLLVIIPLLLATLALLFPAPAPY